MKKQNLKKFKQAPPVKKVKEKSPSNSRDIPEKKKFISLVLNKYFIVSFLTTFLGVALTMQGISVQKSLKVLQNLQGERQSLQNEIIYWEGVTKDRPDYRDANFKLALLEYQLGNKEKAKTYLEKTLEIDPNYKPALDFRKEVGYPYSL